MLRLRFAPLRAIASRQRAVRSGNAGGWLRVLFFFGQFVAAAGAMPASPPANYFVRNWRVDDGLPHNAVNRIVQDARGFLWIATGGGLARFDGIAFKEYPQPATPLHASYNIRDLARENEDALVMLPASGGIARFRDGVFSEHPASSAVAGRQLADHSGPERIGRMVSSSIFNRRSTVAIHSPPERAGATVMKAPKLSG